MLETAYVLPFVLAVILFVVEIVSYAMNSFAANDVLTDVHSSILSEVSDVSNLEPGQSLSYTPIYASCSSGKVVLPTGVNGTLTNHVKTALENKGVTFKAGEPISATISSSSVSGFDVYVIDFKATANSLILPAVFEVMFPMSVDTVISLKDSCTS
ncbi:hypothetical protein QCB45_11180 [Thiomicrorhabdus sp. ZW0627]|uniref:hypothetical protein n=1 Tax=Thiomicrorhabdus sp. ZW0627 TaxID=3039774 RepID=UPI0024372B2A|nr:hypothetical protein [Thiomicrorhabdus sp. ZW0627]MDG6774897.1 hypothetical protein [Thiomicrorhabdus sp. ZW0627]